MTEQMDKQPRPRITWSVGRKLTVASLSMILVVFLVGGIAFWQVSVIRQAIAVERQADEQRAQSLELLAASRELVAALSHIILVQDAGMASTDLPLAHGIFEQRMKRLQVSGRGEEIMAEMRAIHGDLDRAIDEIDVLARQERWDEAHAVLMRDVVSLNEQMRTQVRALVRLAEQDAEAAVSRVRAVIRRAVLLTLVGLVLTTVVGLGWRQLMFQQVSRSIAELRQGVARITGGDLEHRLDIRTGDEIEELGNEFNKMADRLSELIGGLERRVAERTEELEENLFKLEGAAQVARQAAEIRDVDSLLDETVHLISVLFGYYHAGIFMVDEAEEYAVLRTASSTGAQRMLERGHRLKVGEEGIVGDVAGSGTPRIALDVGEEAVFFDNPDLPETRSEMAVPLEARGEVIGVLDIQSREKAAFGDQDVAIIKTLADQIALAIDNARLLKESRRTLRELERLYGQRAREAWRERAGHQPAYRYTGVGVETTSSPDLPPEMEISESRSEPVIAQEQEGDGRQLAAPIRLRGQEIGSIVLRQDPEEEPWSEEEVALLEEVSDQIALALENARLLEETQQRAAREHLAGEITARMRETLDVDRVMQTAIREIGERLDIAEVEVRMRSEDVTGSD